MIRVKNAFFTILLSIVAVTALSGCLVSPDDVFAGGFCSVHVHGKTGKVVGQIKILNKDEDTDVRSELVVDNAMLDRYDFEFNGMPLQFDNDGLSSKAIIQIDDASGSSFGGFGMIANPNDPFDTYGRACIDVKLKEDIMSDVSDTFTVNFFDGSEMVDTEMHKIELTTRPQIFFEFAEALHELYGFSGDALSEIFGLPVGKLIFGSALAQGSQVPTGQTQAVGREFRFVGLGSNFKAFTSFPCGNGPNGFTVCPQPGNNDLAEPLPGDYLYVSTTVDADVVLDDPLNHYIYSFVFDTDGDAGNNWVADPAFPNDFFQGTDRWYEVQYAPLTGWVLVVSQVQADGSILQVATAANAIISGNTVLLVVPQSEVMAGTAAEGERYMRQTTFRHTGDFGLNPPYNYSADVEPPVDVGLYIY